MPSASPKQRKLMCAAAHNPAFAKKVGVPVAVAKEFNAADTLAEHGGAMDMGAKRDRAMRKIAARRERQLKHGKP